MVNGKKIVVIMPAYNAEKTLKATFDEIPKDIVDEIFYFNFNIAEVTCPAKYFKDASSINFKRSVVYGLGVLNTSLKYLLQKTGLKTFRIFDKHGKKLDNIG